MRRILTIAVLGLSAALTVLPAGAQDSGNGNQASEQQGGLPPSDAVKRAVRAHPGAKPLGVKLTDGIYVVRLKQDGTIIQVGVDKATGKVFPLQ